MKKYQYLASWDDQTLTRVGEPVVVLGDSNVSQVEVTLPSNFLLDPTKAECRMYFLLPGEKESDHDVLETAVKDENGDSHVTWTIKHVHSQKGGRLAFSLTLIGDDAQWDSRTAIIPVYESRYQPESEEAEKPYTGRLDALEGSMASIRGEFAEVQDEFEELKETATLGTPIPKSLASEMVKGGVYLYTGTETGYTAGHVYYYVNGSLTDGGVYGGTAVDATLTRSGQAADAKVTGDKIAEIKEDLSAKQDALTFDATPTANSPNPVTSGGVATALTNITVPVDATLTQSGEAADAKATGDAIDAAEDKLSAIAPEEEVLTQITSSGYETFNKYYLNSGVPVSSDNAQRNVFLVPVSAGDKIRALLSARTSGEARYAFHSVANFASCTSGTVISTGSYTDEAYNDFTAPTGAACLLIAAKSLKQCFSVANESKIQCLGVSDEHYHVTKDVSLSVNTGWQAVSVRTIIPSGRKVTAKLTTEAAHGTIQVMIGRSGNGTAFNMNFRVGYGTECSFYTTEFVTGILFNVNNVSVAGSATIDIDITEENVAAESENILYKSLGKNLFNKDDVFRGAFFNTELTYSAGNVISGYIPIANGETVACNYTSGSTSGFYSAVLVKDKYSAETVKTSNKQTITNDLGYDCYALWMVSSSRNLDTVQIEKSEYVSEFKKYNTAGAYVEDNSENTHGKMGALYPDEMKVIDKFIDGPRNAEYKLHFVHISDNHNSKFGNADDFTDNSNAAFLVNTGDMVHDGFADPFDVTSDLINAMTKPGYITLGNHDVYGASTLQARYDKFFAPIAEHNNMSGNTKTYYAVDFATQGVKCIFLDNFDGIDDLATAPINTNGVMSQEQIEWLFAQLDDAIAHSYHVCIFQHYAIAEVARENSVRDWYDRDGSGADTVNWLPQTIDAFQRSATVSFTYREVEYSHTFSGYGSFVAYFVGHEHCDIVGTIDGYPHQLNVTVARPEGGAAWEGASRIDYAPYIFNYCTVDTKAKHLSVFRVGQQRTVWGTKRDVFTWRYWTAR